MRVSDSIRNDYPVLHAAQTRFYERLLLSVGFHFPVEMHNAAVRAGLTGEHFAYEAHSWMFATLCTAADHGFRLTYDELIELNGRDGDPFLLAFNPNELAELVEEDVLDTDIDRWAQAVKTLADRRRRAEELRREARDLIGEPFDASLVTETPHNCPVGVASKLRRRGRGAHAA